VVSYISVFVLSQHVAVPSGYLVYFFLVFRFALFSRSRFRLLYLRVATSVVVYAFNNVLFICDSSPLSSGIGGT
jgi:hypothetical protein